MSIKELRELCVNRFPGSVTRPKIMYELEEVARILFEYQVEGQLWIDGSFLTEKTDPNDVDFVLRINGDLYDNGSPEQKQAIDWVSLNLNGSQWCHSFVFLEYDEPHPQFWHSRWMHAYWIRHFGFSRGQEMKGIALYVIGSDRRRHNMFFWHTQAEYQQHALTPPSMRKPWLW